MSKIKGQYTKIKVYAHTHSQRECAKQFGVSQGTVSKIVRSKSYQDYLNNIKDASQRFKTNRYLEDFRKGIIEPETLSRFDVLKLKIVSLFRGI